MVLGIGSAVAIFSVVNTVLLQPLPYPGADRVAMVWNHFTQLGFPRLLLSDPEFYDYRDGNTSFQSLAAISVFQGNLTGMGEAERISIASVSPSLFSILKTQPSRGRVFVEGEDRPGAPRPAVLSDAFWRRSANPRLVGRELLINGTHYTVVGVMPPSFRFPEKVDLWVPFPPPAKPDRGNHRLLALGRLKPGVALRTAQLEMETIAQRMQQASPNVYPRDSGWGVSLIPLHEDLIGNVRPALLLVLAAVGLVLFMACANVANLQLERALARSGEIALRMALGEPRRRLIRRFIAESLFVSCIGGGGGVLVAALAVRALTRIDPEAIPRAYDIALDSRVLLFALALALASGLLIGVVPALETSKLSLTEALKEGGEKTVGGRRRQRTRRVLVILETALALVLVVGAGLLVRTFTNLQRVDPGFKADNTLTLRIALPVKKYKDERQMSGFFARLVEGVSALPGVRHAGVIDCLPMSDCDLSSSYYVEEHMPPPGSVPPEADLRVISPDYFRAMGMSLRQGKFFSNADSADAPEVVIVDEGLARRTWPGESPLGKRVKLTKNMATPWRTVVGMVGHVQNTNLYSRSREQLYLPLAQFATNRSFLVIRSDANPNSLVGPVRALLKQLDPDIPIFDVQTLSDRVAKSIARQQLSMSLLLGLAVLALFLAAVGMYSVITYSVNQRSRELGIRMALGAQRRDVLGMVVGEGLLIALVGILAGLLLAYWATRLLGSLLFEISATDLVTYLATSLLLIVIAAAASYFPARKATRVSPMAALGRS